MERKFVAKISYTIQGNMIVTKCYSNEKEKCHDFLKGQILMIPLIRAMAPGELNIHYIVIIDRDTNEETQYEEKDFS